MPSIDPGTGLTVLGSAIGGKSWLKNLGPTAEYIGDGLQYAPINEQGVFYLY